MNPILKAFIFVPLMHIGAATAADCPDYGFLKKEPYRKTKQRVDVSSIKTCDALSVLAESIDSVTQFLVGISFGHVSPIVSDRNMTEHGRQVLRLPPLRNPLKRYSVQKIEDWTICGREVLSFDATFSDLLQKNFWTESFTFVNTVDGWRFEDHTRRTCSALDQST
jgi:hypothetical protein